jgi:hypothetical protein
MSLSINRCQRLVVRLTYRHRQDINQGEKDRWSRGRPLHKMSVSRLAFLNERLTVLTTGL